MTSKSSLDIELFSTTELLTEVFRRFECGIVALEGVSGGLMQQHGSLLACYGLSMAVQEKVKEEYLMSVRKANE